MPIIVVFFIITVLILVSCKKNVEKSIDTKEVVTIDNPVISPSGKYQLKVIEETIDGVEHNKFAIFKVLNSYIESEATFVSCDAYRTRDTLYFVWDDKDRVWVYSGDLGTFFWEHVSDNEWEKRSFADNRSVPVPSLLKQLKPGHYEN